MRRRTLIATVGAVVGTGIGTAAYTSASVTRSATINVSADDTALVQLTPSADFSQITKDGGGQLSISFSSLNGGSEFVFGDATSPNTTYAFSLTPSEGNDVTFSYTLTNSDLDGGNPNVQFDVYSWDDTNTQAVDEATASEESSGTFTATAGTTYYVVLTIDTTNVDTSTTDLSGTLTITA
ncbi:DUF1102 domain-containing protein [Halomicroarcula sp. F13]|uniref:DUF1102 domain-containing protein n=1 Tax=Haloarcula rubra TaxID=2487747 RepID=A0AAW4PPB6_9EURY|nr:DUF1102 domain-containing protein [Halomicroarcula rubra]MBX0323020.1 DUF1102 domain-containing protein [Halomicroarcula rubra]